MKLPIGTRVKVREGCGLNSHREGVVVPVHILPVNHRGIPDIGEGHYKPFEPSREAVIRDKAGKVFTMFWGCLKKLG